jgi:hypothetical protein
MHGVNEASPSLPLVPLASAKSLLDSHGRRRGPGTTRYRPYRAHQGDICFAPMEQRTRFCPRQVRSRAPAGRLSVNVIPPLSFVSLRPRPATHRDGAR